MSTSLFTRRVCAAVGALVLPLGVLATLPASAHSGHGHDSSVTVRIKPLKGENANGTATLTPTKNGGLRVELDVSGMVPGQPHAQHIHGDTTGKEFFCPGADRDTDNDGFLTVEEGLPDYGNIHISLTTKGDTSPKSGLAVDRMPVADADGNVSYERTLSAAQLPEGTLAQLDHLHIVQHGVDANDNDEYDLDGLGESTFAKSLGVSGIPEEATDAATCGMVTPSGGVATGGGDSNHAMVAEAGLAGAGAVLLTAAGVLLVARRRVAADRYPSDA